MKLKAAHRIPLPRIATAPTLVDNEEILDVFVVFRRREQLQTVRIMERTNDQTQ